MKDICQRLSELSQKGCSAVIATIIQQTGPSPRGIGTKCLVTKDGSLLGTIGGGLLEAKTLEEAKKVFETGLPLRLYFSLKGSDVAKTDMLCGGQVEVFLEPVSPKDEDHLAIFQNIMKITHSGGGGLLATVLDQDMWRHGKAPKIFLRKGVGRIGSFPGAEELVNPLVEKMEDILKSRQPQIVSLPDEKGNMMDIFVEPLIAGITLYVFGGGHVSRKIVPLASLVGFDVVVIDDRPEFADPGHFPEATEIHQLPFERVMERLPIDESSFLVIVTRGHIHDKSVLSQALRTNAKYIGMIGSRRKRNIIYEKLLKEGFTQEDISRVHAPIGLEIGAETPEEIAVSIVAELIGVRAGKLP